MMLQNFYQSVVVSTIFFVVVYWGAEAKDTNRLKYTHREGRVCCMLKASLSGRGENMMLVKLQAIMDNDDIVRSSKKK